MQPLRVLSSPRMSTLMLGICALLLIISMILFPDQAFKASLQGIQLWWKLVFPALLPFLIITEIMRGIGALHGIGALLEPLLRILFRLPGISGWLIALGFTAGMPVGAAAISTLRCEGQLTRDEAERLLGATHVLSPVFLITIVGVGFLHSATIGLALAVIHYGSMLLVLLAQRMSSTEEPLPLTGFRRRGVFAHALEAFRAAGARDGRTFGKLLGDAVSVSVQQSFIIGGYIMMFSVLLKVIDLSGLLTVLSSPIALLGVWSSEELNRMMAALLPGMFEAHLGAFAFTQAEAVSSVWQYALLSLVLAWGGLSAITQVRSLTVATDLRFKRFLKFRLWHAGTAFILTPLVWEPLNSWLTRQQEPLSAFNGGQSAWALDQGTLWPFVSPMMLQFGTILLLLVVISIFTAFLFRRGER